MKLSQHRSFQTKSHERLFSKRNTLYSFSKSTRRGFTLVELLVVVAIIVIMGGAIVGVMSGGGKGQSLNAAVSTLTSSIQTARTIAMMKGQTAYLIINNDPSSPDRYLRYIGIIYEDPDVPGEWIAANAGQSLPEGIYVLTDNADTSEISGDALSIILDEIDDAGDIIQITYPSNRAVALGTGNQWLAYKFGADGIAQPGTANKKFALAIGSPTGTGGARFDEVYQSAYVMISLFGGTISAEYDDL